jgi:uncharacterized protein (TIGR03790 family)
MRFSSIIVALVLLVAGPLVALEPEQVLVVANERSGDSVELAKFYAKTREIPQANILLLRTSTGYEIPRESYDEQIVEPIREYLTESKLALKIRCIVLMYGVPVRIGPQKDAVDDSPEARLYRSSATKAAFRLAISYKLLGTVGRAFPEPQVDELTPVGKLFGALSSPAEQPDDVSAVIRDFTRESARRQLSVPRIQDARKRRIASRQLMALSLDAFGIKGLLRLLENDRLPGRPDVDALKKQLDEAQEALDEIQRSSPLDAEKIQRRLELIETIGGAAMVHGIASKEAPPASPKPKNFAEKSRTSNGAAVDSELSMLWYNGYQLAGPAGNMMHWRLGPQMLKQIPREQLAKLPPPLITCRIDGPSPKDARRIIQDSMAAEKQGLDGKFYIDAGGLPRAAAYDENFLRLASFLKAKAKIEPVLDERVELFGEGDCPQAALYVGWYSLKKYIPAFRWQQGAVGWHVASFEAMSLRDPNSTEWVPKMIQNGVAATFGAVNEPLLDAFPLPQEFFPLLLTGKLTVAECYWRTVPHTSWQLTLICDPLYTPFKVRPMLKPDDLPAGLMPPKAPAR